MTIRPATPADAPSVASLSAELGYPVSAEIIAERLAQLKDTHTVRVAVEDARIVGWIELVVTFHLTSGSRVEIGGLVVAATHRNRGIGAQLVADAEQWARARGETRILVRSNEKRADAHRFYLRANYTRLKTSAVFEKTL